MKNLRTWCSKHIWQSILIFIAILAIVGTSITLPIVLSKKDSGEPTPPPAPVTYTVTFVLDGKGTDFTDTVESGSKLTKPTDPTYEGYTFGGWYKESEHQNQWKFDVDVVNADLSLYAKWDMDPIKVTKVADYLYTFESCDYESNMPTVTSETNLTKFYGSSVVNGNNYGRNFDSRFDEECEFVVKTSATDSRHATIGIASSLVESITDEMVEDLSNESLKELTWFMVDGMNDSKLTCSMNIVYTQDLSKKNTNGTNPGKDEIKDIFLVRALLDNCSSVDEVKTYLNNHNVTSVPNADWDIHLLVADTVKTAVIEFTGDEEPIKYDDQKIMTNFYNHLVDKNKDEHVISRYPGLSTGRERYTILFDNYNTGNSMQGMKELMKKVRYTTSYDTSTDPFWASEFFYEIPTFKDKAPEYWAKNRVLSEENVKKIIGAFEQYQQTGELSDDVDLYHTSHSVVYDMQNKKLSLTLRENFDFTNSFNFSLD